MSIKYLEGVWTYRSFKNLPDLIGDFNKLTVWEAELYLEVDEESGSIYGHLGERPEKSSGKDPFLYLKGTTSDCNPPVVTWRALGKKGTEYDGWIYDYSAVINPIWADGKGDGNRPTLTGTVTRTVAHGNAPAGSVFSFIAVKRDFLEPRACIPLNKDVADMLASLTHRLHHQLWHASRDEWVNPQMGSLSEAKRDALRKLNWQPGPIKTERNSQGAGRFGNASGEDFLFMHRQMIQHVKKMQEIPSWPSVPSPSALAGFDKDFEKGQVGNPDGFAVPEAWIVPGDPDTTRWLYELRKTSTFYSRFLAWQSQYTDPSYLSRISLGELGSRIEFTIHNWMHMRWASVPKDPDTGALIPSGRDPLDFDEKWFKPEYDYLGETFSSHVNPIFWRLHGWVDDRINDWFDAHEKAHKGKVISCEYGGIKWFKKGDWVALEEPWVGPIKPSHGGHHHGEVDLDPVVMKQALNIIFGTEPVADQSLSMTEANARSERGRSTWFRIFLD